MATNGACTGRSFAKIMEDFRQSSKSLENAADFVTLLGFGFNLYAAIRIVNEFGGFKILASSTRPITVSDIVKNIKGVPKHDLPDSIADREEYVGRMLRAVASLNLVDETEASTFQANEITITMAEPGFDLGFKSLYDQAANPTSTLSHMVSWGREQSWKAPERAADGPFHTARDIVGTNTFEYWLQQDPGSLTALSALMKVTQRHRLNWHSWFPEDALFGSSATETSNEVFMVDMGGGLGHDIAGLAARYPQRNIRLVLEDQPEVIAEARKENLDPRIELIGHNFFKPQPVKGAKIYFMHKIMHDWPDYECVQILTHLRDAMSPDSRIFINDCILADTGNPATYTAFDMTMFIQLNAKERNEFMWKRLISKVVGLEIRKFWQAPELKGEGIVEVIKSP